eukprot:jgi/Tetstr1/455750/TSEL_042549.t1
MERAVVGNMKEAYVSVFAPSQLGVGISARNSVLMYGVRFDKMHAYNADTEAVRREATADIEWSVLDYGHHGILALNAFAEDVDATVTAVERVLGVSLDPSTSGNNTKPVVTKFLTELLHDHDPTPTEAATLSEDAWARARSRLHLPTRLKGARIRHMATVCYAAFLTCMNDILPSYAAAMREAWGRLQAATVGHLNDADAHVMEREAEAARVGLAEERILFGGSVGQLDAASGMWTVAIPTAWTVMTA